MNFRTLLAAVVGGAVLWRWAGKRRQRQQQRQVQARTSPAEVSWEGEGGALRGSAGWLDPARKLP
jgi:hypothetical protein